MKILSKIFAGIEAFVFQDQKNFVRIDYKITKMPSSLQVRHNTNNFFSEYRIYSRISCEREREREIERERE